MKIKKNWQEDSPFHDGEVKISQRYPSNFHWDHSNIGQLIREHIPESVAAILERQPFFFIATSNARGHCDASFRGREFNAFGPLPVCKVLDPKVLVFPDFSGNGLYQSLGNIHDNPQIGMLFIDFEQQLRFRVNGRASVLDPDKITRAVWPMAQAQVRVDVQQAYGNCQARIPRMRIVPGSDDPLY